MIQYYEDVGDQKRIRPDLLNNDAYEVSKKIVIKRNDGTVDEDNSIHSAQLRRFYNEFKAIQKKATDPNKGKITEESFFVFLPLIKLVKSKVAYATKPSKNKIPQQFKDWLTDNIESINTAEDFKAFLLYFEAVVGFCYGRGLKNK